MVKIPTIQNASQLSYEPQTTLQQASAMGQGIAKLGSMVQQISQKEQVRLDNEQFLEAKTKYDAWNLEFETQAAQRQGTGVNGLTRDFESAEQEKWNEIFTGLSPRSAQAFEQYRGDQLGIKRKFHALAELQGKQLAARNTFNSSFAVLEQEMLENPFDIEGHLTKAKENFELGVSSGAVLPSEQETFEVRLTEMTKNSWKALFEQAPQEALKVAGKYGLSNSMKDSYTDKYEEKQISARSIQLVNELTANGKTLAENEKYVHQQLTDDRKMHDETIRRLQFRDAQEQSARLADQKARKEAAYAQMDEIGLDAEKMLSVAGELPRELQEDAFAYARRLLTPESQVLTNPDKMVEAENAVLDGTIKSEKELKAAYYKDLNGKDYDRIVETLKGKAQGERPLLREDELVACLVDHGVSKDRNDPETLKRFNTGREFVRRYFDRENPQSGEDKNHVLASAMKELLRDGISKDADGSGADKKETYLDARVKGHESWRIAVPQKHKEILRATTHILGANPHTSEEERTFYERWRPVYDQVPKAEVTKILNGLKKPNRTANTDILISPESVLNAYHARKDRS